MIDEAFTAQHADALEIGVDLGCPMDAAYIGSGASGHAMSYEDCQSNEGTRCACTLASPYGQQCQARAVVASLLARHTTNPGQGTA
ncbi:hypothetical protein [Azohydromonas lata]|uniref:Uncharacterized protein n=1 Tax=Azohydromonas lata TaxID=45677 RepID=A0ABU5IRS8_9BURK|nr:hypothetical protein [Azohydromonas lata]MDZ5461597.1 hypothetical protein [Azohydromonas lata]